MTVETGGDRRGFIARWLMRIQAIQGQLQLIGIAITAASTLTSALVALGAERFAPYLLAAGLLFAPAYAYFYVETGLLNRKNRETNDRASNFSDPTMLIDDILIAHAVYAAIEGEPPDEEDAAQLRETVRQEWSRYRNGAPLETEVADD